jgi:small subunit ribosomal protein S4e
MKNHLKRIAAPKTWVINRKSNVFVLRPNSGSHPLKMGLALGVVMRDMLKLAATMDEVRKILSSKEVLVDGKRKKDHRCIVGLFDVISFPTMKKNFRVLLDSKMRLVVKEVSDVESLIKPCKIVGKTVLHGGKIQFNLFDGKNIISSEKAKVGDTFLLTLPKLEVKETLPLIAGATIFLTGGKHSADVGVLKEIIGKEASYTMDKKNIETSKKHIFVIGKKESKINVAI